jgi:hypothetical protein
MSARSLLKDASLQIVRADPVRDLKKYTHLVMQSDISQESERALCRHEHTFSKCEIVVQHRVDVSGAVRYIIPPILFFVSVGLSIYTGGKMPVIQYSVGGFAFASVINLMRK